MVKVKVINELLCVEIHFPNLVCVTCTELVFRQGTFNSHVEPVAATWTEEEGPQDNPVGCDTETQRKCFGKGPRLGTGGPGLAVGNLPVDGAEWEGSSAPGPPRSPAVDTEATVRLTPPS